MRLLLALLLACNLAHAGPFAIVGGSGSSTAPTGTGFTHVTSGVTDPAAVAETGTGSVVRATSPTLVTPVLGVATATSVAIGGATIGSSYVATPAGSSTSPAVSIGTNGSTGIYSRSAAFLNLVAGGTIVADLSSSNIVFGGPSVGIATGTSATGATAAFLTAISASTVQHGAVDAASPVAQIVQSQGTRAGTDTNTGGGNFTIRSGNGTGTGTISSLILQSPVAAASGTGAQTQTTGLTIKQGAYVSTGYAVASLPASPATGSRAHVTDSNATITAGIGAVVAAGGANIVPVFYDGTNWRIM